MSSKLSNLLGQFDANPSTNGQERGIQDTVEGLVIEPTICIDENSDGDCLVYANIHFSWDASSHDRSKIHDEIMEKYRELAETDPTVQATKKEMEKYLANDQDIQGANIWRTLVSTAFRQTRYNDDESISVSKPYISRKDKTENITWEEVE